MVAAEVIGAVTVSQCKLHATYSLRTNVSIAVCCYYCWCTCTASWLTTLEAGLLTEPSFIET